MSVVCGEGVALIHAHGILTITDANTTIGYCRHDGDGAIEYIFVHPAFRRQGHAKRMLALVRERVGKPLRLEPPISPLGSKLLRHCDSGF
ncbi:MAG: GNAT family N-acetyltransferase [Burkholderiales bacterium]|nr:GNAT family N-acetyltransferase [Burkholderiales bacterium]MDP2398291.1 GNAT family N-acetyltransferase [Burkholderiales bacterium]MDP3715147.1 GNAT family N-acetyltransferase [Burkholderiales bacterium]